MKRLLANVFAVAVCNPSADAANKAKREELLILLSSDKGYAITAYSFSAAVQEYIYHSRIPGPGKSIFQTNAGTEYETWMIRTGVYEILTVRLSYYVSRLIGLFQSKSP